MYRNYCDAAAAAQAQADETGFDVGLEYNSIFQEFRVFGLPAKKDRQGFETRCEVRYCSDVARIRPGHGPGGRGPST